MKYSKAVAPAFTLNSWFAVPKAVKPVPPLFIPIVEAFHVPVPIVPKVVILVEPAQVLSSVFYISKTYY